MANKPIHMLKLRQVLRYLYSPKIALQQTNLG